MMATFHEFGGNGAGKSLRGVRRKYQNTSANREFRIKVVELQARSSIKSPALKLASSRFCLLNRQSRITVCNDYCPFWRRETAAAANKVKYIMCLGRS